MPNLLCTAGLSLLSQSLPLARLWGRPHQSTCRFFACGPSTGLLPQFCLPQPLPAYYYVPRYVLSRLLLVVLIRRTQLASLNLACANTRLMGMFSFVQALNMASSGTHWQYVQVFLTFLLSTLGFLVSSLCGPFRRARHSRRRLSRARQRQRQLTMYMWEPAGTAGHGDFTPQIPESRRRSVIRSRIGILVQRLRDQAPQPCPALPCLSCPSSRSLAHSQLLALLTAVSPSR